MFIHGSEIAKIEKERLSKLFKGKDITLMIISVGNNPESQNYIKWKLKDCEVVNINGLHTNYDENIDFEILKENILKFANDSKINGIILQIPLPDHLTPYKQELLDLIPTNKDVDGLNSSWINKRYFEEDVIYPATPQGVIQYIETNKINYVGKVVALIGASPLVNRSLIQYFINKRATPIVLQSKSDLNIVKNADIVIVAVGRINLLRKEFVKPGAFIIDCGTTYENGKLKGDVSSDVSDVASYVSPVPGGVGPLTRLNIFLNLEKLMNK